MASALLEDQRWKLIQPFLPDRKRRDPYPGRKRINDHKILSGILFVLITGIAWQQLPHGLGTARG